MFKVHELKILKQFYDAVKDGTKTFEIRLNDRNYQVRDIIQFCVINDDGTLTRDKTLYEITYVLDDARYMLEGYVALSIIKRGHTPCWLHTT